MIVGCFFNTPGETVQLFPAVVIPTLLFSNFVVSLNQIPVWIRWLQWIDAYKYFLDASCITEYRGQKHNYECYQDNTGNTICKYMYDGPAYLKELDVGYMNTWGINKFINSYQDSIYFDWIMMFVLLIIFRFISWIILVKRLGW